MDKKKIIILALALAVILGGAYILYDKLGSRVSAEQIAAEGTPANTEQVSLENSGSSDPEGQNSTGNASDPSEKTNTSDDTASSNTAVSEYRAPDFTVLDADGKEVRLSDLFGTPIVLNFWASWCSPCQAEMPEFDAVCSELDGKVVFMMVNLTDGSRETMETARKFVQSSGFTFPVYFDTGGSAASAYGIVSIPTTYFIDKNGDLIARAVGTIDRETLDKGISMITE